MKIGYSMFDGITLLDFIGIYDPISRLKSMQFIPDLEWDLCALQPQVEDSFGLKVLCNKVNTALSEYDMIVVPGGLGTRQLQHDPVFIDWLRMAQSVSYKVSVCTGSLLLGAAGFLAGKHATTHFQEYATLKTYCRTVLPHRIVEDGDVITAGAVASSIDLGLYICEKLAGAEAKEKIRHRMDYHRNESSIYGK